VFGRRDPDRRGYFGEFGGRFMPETLIAPVEALEAAYFEARTDPAFVARLRHLLSTYVGRPTPLHEAHRAAAGSRARLFLKREDLAHTGAHKINNALGQALLAAAWASAASWLRPARDSTAWPPLPCARCSDSSASSTWVQRTWRGRR
jgi:tryptophan synthase beta subunit